MKPANFPGRKNDRRIRALAQLQRGENTKADRLGRPPGFSRSSEIKVISSLIVSAEVARNVRTKKDRSSRAKVRS
jgi:hypothetical protein